MTQPCWLVLIVDEILLRLMEHQLAKIARSCSNAFGLDRPSLQEGLFILIGMKKGLPKESSCLSFLISVDQE